MITTPGNSLNDKLNLDLSQYQVLAVLSDEESICVRAIRPQDKDRLADHFNSLGSESSYYRFFGHRREIALEELERFTRPDFERHVAIVGTCWENGTERIVADARYVAHDPDRTVAELAISVVDSHHHRGIGTVMIEQLALLAYRQGIQRLEGDVMAENRRALEFLVARGFRPHRSREGGVLRLTLPVSELRYEPARFRAITREDLSRRAYDLFVARGYTHGNDLHDWLAAERELVFGIAQS